MAKRFTDSNLWKNQRWFRKLKPHFKLAFCYIKDMCNHAGLWRIDCSDLMDDLGIDEFDFDDFIKSCNTEYDKITGKCTFKERLRVIGDQLWLTGFIQFQYEGKEGLVNPHGAPVRTALQLLMSADKGCVTLTEGLSKGYIVLSEPLPNSLARAKDKDKDKDITELSGDRGVGKGDLKTASVLQNLNGSPIIPSAANYICRDWILTSDDFYDEFKTPDFRKEWIRFMDYRASMKPFIYMDIQSQESMLRSLYNLTHDPKRAIAIINQTITDSNKTFYELNDRSSKPKTSHKFLN